MNSIKFCEFFPTPNATEVTKNVYFCPALDNSNEDNFDTSNGNSIDLTELDEPIRNRDYLFSFKPEKSTGVGTQLVDLQDYKISLWLQEIVR
ncbi:unnamed protein product [Rhizophagus irregularis]|nr:unnamed protein product [Rhizophagus irregularis]